MRDFGCATTTALSCHLTDTSLVSLSLLRYCVIVLTLLQVVIIAQLRQAHDLVCVLDALADRAVHPHRHLLRNRLHGRGVYFRSGRRSEVLVRD